MWNNSLFIIRINIDSIKWDNRHIIWHTQVHLTKKESSSQFQDLCLMKYQIITWICHILCPAVPFIWGKCKTEKATLDFCIVWNFKAFYWNFSLSTNSEIRMIHIHFGLNVSTISKSRTMNVYCDFGLSFYCIMFDKKVSKSLDQTILYELKCGKN